ncbi:Mariner transposase [Oopsacas minuta]|uniref:Mariner transposase n=1 Tax=Oopsacas minuta TaxID=111878 RepID=A0AAV7K4J1_9METZ|nr:Mariner transposase [Oopsacas minuta]
MRVIFFRSSEFVEAVAFEDRKTVTADWYTTVCLPKVITAIKSQRQKTGIRGILLHHDNASSHTAIRTRELLENSGLKTLPHPLYSPDLAPCDFWLFPRLKDQLRGRRFSTNEELRGALFQAIGDIPKEEWKKCFDNWFTLIKKCIDCQENILKLCNSQFCNYNLICRSTSKLFECPSYIIHFRYNYRIRHPPTFLCGRKSLFAPLKNSLREADRALELNNRMRTDKVTKDLLNKPNPMEKIVLRGLFNK